MDNDKKTGYGGKANQPLPVAGRPTPSLARRGFIFLFPTPSVRGNIIIVVGEEQPTTADSLSTVGEGRGVRKDRFLSRFPPPNPLREGEYYYREGRLE